MYIKHYGILKHIYLLCFLYLLFVESRDNIELLVMLCKSGDTRSHLRLMRFVSFVNTSADLWSMTYDDDNFPPAYSVL